MGENAGQIEREIMAERNELGRNLEVLQTKARDMADWRVHYRNHPGVFLGAAAGVGVLLGAMSRRHREESFGYVNYARTPEPETVQPRRSLSERLNGPRGRKLMETWEHATEALMAVGTAMPSWLGERLDLGYAIDVLHPRALNERPTGQGAA